MKNKPLTCIAWIIFSIAVFTISCDRASKKKRPQDPGSPYGYYTEDVTFRNDSANITLAGTLTLPSKEGVYPAVILISGSGPQDRNSEFAGHRPFLVLADHLTTNGIAVLRYDDRGYGQSTGSFDKGTSLDFSYDVESAVEYLKTRKEIRKNKIGLMGHSDGAMVAPMVAARSGDINFMVLLAGPGVPGPELLLTRQELLERKMGIPEMQISKSRRHSEQMIRIVVNSKDTETAKLELIEFSKTNYDEIPAYAVPPGMSKDAFILKHIEMLSSAWFKLFLTYDPATTLRKVKCPVLALNGDKDVQVPSESNLRGIEQALMAGGNQNVTIKEMAGLNHAFQECVTGMPEEYGKIEQTFAPVALKQISDWVLQQTRN